MFSSQSDKASKRGKVCPLAAETTFRGCKQTGMPTRSDFSLSTQKKHLNKGLVYHIISKVRDDGKNLTVNQESYLIKKKKTDKIIASKVNAWYAALAFMNLTAHLSHCILPLMPDYH